MLASSSNSGRMSGRLALLAIVAALGVTGCADPEIDRPGTWKPTGINDQNLRAMLADPQDLSGGTGALTARGNSASRAVTRLLIDRRRPLLDASVSQVAPSTGSAADGGAIQTPGSGTSGGTP